MIVGMTDNSKLPRELFRATPPGDKTHPLIEPRFVAAIALAAFGTFGVTLMLARVLIVVGLIISLMCSAGIVWIYAEHFRAAYRSLSNKIEYKGAGPKELVTSIILIAIMAPVSISVYLTMSEDPPNITRPIIFMENITQRKLPGSPMNKIDVQLSNKGAMAALNLATAMTGRLSDKLIDPNEIDAELDEMESVISSAEKTVAAPQTQLQPGTAAVITLQDIRPETWAHLIDNPSIKPAPPILELSDEQWSDVMQGRKLIYVLFVAHFDDEMASKDSYWKIAQCAYFIYTTSYYRNCNNNRTVRVPGRRYKS